mmetsp:Transcript_18473/g.41791  ORF Transcript_18473/g.41791 Transcript_18473/m.41791 type:complete len:268 (-) Transcript_18473:77-880(-)
MAAPWEQERLPAFTLPQQTPKDLPDASSETGIDLERVFPGMFFFGCLFLFTPPLVKCIDLAFTPEFVFFKGHAAAVVSFVPIVLLLYAFSLLRSHKGPKRLAVIVGFFGPCLVLLLWSIIVVGQADSLGMRLRYYGTSSPETRALELAWTDAKDFYAGCLHEDGGATGALLIESCPGYEQRVDGNWAFLARMEHKHECGGWLAYHRQLWGFGDLPSCSCGRAVADVLQNKVKSTGLQVSVHVLFLTFGIFLLLMFLRPKLEASFHRW